MEILMNEKVIFHFKMSQQDISFDTVLFILRMKPGDIQLCCSKQSLKIVASAGWVKYKHARWIKQEDFIIHKGQTSVYTRCDLYPCITTHVHAHTHALHLLLQHICKDFMQTTSTLTPNPHNMSPLNLMLHYFKKISADFIQSFNLVWIFQVFPWLWRHAAPTKIRARRATCLDSHPLWSSHAHWVTLHL